MGERVKLHLAVDLDDVVVNFFPHVLACLKREYGIDISMEQITDWDDNPVKHLRIFGEGRDWWDWLRGRDWLWAKADAIEGAIGGIDTLRRQGHYVEGLTSKPEWAEWCVWAFCGKWRPPFNRLTIAPLGERKVDLSDAEILIDDAPHNVAPWVAAPNGRSAILFDKPWNANVPIDPITTARAKNWADVLRIVEEWS